MTDFTQLRARLAADARYAKYSHTDNVRMSDRGRQAARTKLERDIIAAYHLDPSAPDFDDRLQHGISAHYRGLKLKQIRRVK